MRQLIDAPKLKLNWEERVLGQERLYVTPDPGFQILDRFWVHLSQLARWHRRFTSLCILEITIVPWINFLTALGYLQFLNQFDYGQNHLDGVIHFSGSHHQRQDSVDCVVSLVLLKQAIVVEVNLEQFGQRLESVKAAIEILEDDRVLVLLLYLS